MNILFLSTENPYPPDHGHYIRTYNVLKYVSQHHDVYFIGFIKNKEDFRNVEPIRKMCKTADVFVIPDDVSSVRFYLSLFLNFFSPLPYIAQKYYQKSMKQKIREILKENKIDIVHFDMLHLSRYQSMFDGIPTTLTEHNVESLRILSLLRNSRNVLFKAFMYLQYIKLKSFEKKACAGFNICAAVSEDDLKVLKTMSPSANFVVIPNGVDTGYFAPDDTPFLPNSMIWVGGMDNIYNREAVDVFIEEIFPLIQKEIPAVKFTVVGKSPTRKLLHLAKTNKNIEVVGYVDDVRPYICKTAVYIAPIKSGGGTKLKILNALSLAKPVITTSVGAEGIEVEDNKHLLIADEPGLFAGKTIELLKNPEIAAKLGENGRNLMIEKYDWGIIGEKMNRVYEELLTSKY
ncbi:MAG: glycosyltransferase family 4 protein [Nitrospirota bacterium]|nr:glycosyltransferase family 4 protein [Nitrospirota bacterium]